MRIGIRSGLVIFVLATVALTSGVVHVLWWRTAQSNSRMLADTLNQQIIGEVKKELASLIASAEAAHGAIRTIFVQEVIGTREADKREFVFLSQMQAQAALSWIAFGWPDQGFFAAHKLGDKSLEMTEIPPGAGPRSRRVDTYKILPGDIEFQERHFELTSYDVTAQPWYREASLSTKPLWARVTAHPDSGRPAIAFAGRIDVDQVQQGVLAVMIDLDRMSRFLAGLTVGRSGAAFVLGQDGIAVAVPDPEADEVHGTMVRHPELLAVARQTHNQALAKASEAQKQISEARVVYDDVPYAVTVTPLGFMGWEVTTVVPESDFLGSIEDTNTRLSLALVLLIVAAVAASLLLARLFLIRPLRSIAEELGHVERFELDQVRHRPYRLSELNTLSRVTASMALGLSAFRKYIPADLVRTLIAEGIEAKPGGTVRPLTILFADIEGFTGMSERGGSAIVPLLERYIDLMSREVLAHGGTIDKFIGDAVMALWGAPASNPNHCLDACRAALACQRALAQADIIDDCGRALFVRIGVSSGDVLVGNIGSDQRLSYTAIGDAVNVASRIEGVNKVYGTRIIIGEPTRQAAGDEIWVRELDRTALDGRTVDMAIYELLGLSVPGGSPPAWVTTYEAALDLYRGGLFGDAIPIFEAVVTAKGGDKAAELMVERCRAFLSDPPPAGWNGVAPPHRVQVRSP